MGPMATRLELQLHLEPGARVRRAIWLPDKLLENTMYCAGCVRGGVHGIVDELLSGCGEAVDVRTKGNTKILWLKLLAWILLRAI